MNTFFSLADIYSYKVKLTLNQKEKISTSLGKLFSAITYIILLIFTWFVGNDFIFRSNPFSYVDEKIGNSFPRINITRELFPMCFGLSDIYGAPIRNDSLIEFKLFKYDFFLNETLGYVALQNTTEIELVKCTKSHFPTVSQEDYYNAALNEYFCPKDYSEIFVEGSWISSSLTTLGFVVTKCDFKNNPEKCGTNEEIDRLISDNGLNYNIYYVEDYISVVDYSNPIQPKIINKFKFLDSQTFKITNLYLQQNFLKTDIAIFSNNYEAIQFAKLVESPTDWINFDENSRRLAIMTIYTSNISQIYFRKYIKLSDILAAVGGLIKVFFLFFKLIRKPFLHMEKFNLLLKS